EERAELVPNAVERQKDGAYLISSHLDVDRGATLGLHDEDKLVVHLESTTSGVTTTVSNGGSLDSTGGKPAPLDLSAWERAPRGGLALAGSDAPARRTAAGEVINDPKEASAVAPDPNSPVLLPDPDEEQQDRTVSATLERVSVREDAIGLFAANTSELRIHDSDFSDNLLDGVVLHRFVTAARLTEVTAHSNGGDGIRAGRGTTEISIEGARTYRNRDNGITLNGSALADGPGATGLPTGMFGGHAVTGSTVSANGHYGIQVNGGA